MSNWSEGSGSGEVDFEKVLVAQLSVLRNRLIVEHRRQIQVVLKQGKSGQAGALPQEAGNSVGQLSTDTWADLPVETGRRSCGSPIEMVDMISDAAERSDATTPDLRLDKELGIIDVVPDAPETKAPEPPLSKPPVIVAERKVAQQPLSAPVTAGLIQAPDMALPGFATAGGIGPNEVQEKNSRASSKASVPAGNTLAKSDSKTPQALSIDADTTSLLMRRTPSQSARIAAIRRAVTPDVSIDRPESPTTPASPSDRAAERDRALDYDVCSLESWDAADDELPVGTTKSSESRDSVDSTKVTQIQVPEGFGASRVTLAVPSRPPKAKAGRASHERTSGRDGSFRLRNSISNPSTPGPGDFGKTRSLRNSELGRSGSPSTRDSYARDSMIRIPSSSNGRRPSTQLAHSNSDTNHRSCSFRLDDDAGYGAEEGRSRNPSQVRHASRRDSRFSVFRAERSDMAGGENGRGSAVRGGSLHLRASGLSLPGGAEDALSQAGSRAASRAASRAGSDESAESRYPSMYGEDSCYTASWLQYEVLPIWYFRKARRNDTVASKKRVELNLFEEDEDDADRTGITRYMIAPGTTKHIIWDALGLMLIGWGCFVIPLQWFSPKRNLFFTVLGWVSCLYWSINMIISFLVGYIDSQGHVNMHPVKIAKRYLMTWFLLDVVTVGSDWAEVIFSAKSSVMTMGATLRSLRMLRTIRLLRLFRAPLIWRYFTEQIRSEELILVAQLCKMMILMLIVAHFIACGWYGMGDAGFDGNWLQTPDSDGRSIPDMDLALRYAMTVHWSLSMFTGDTVITGTNLAERTYTCVVLFFAFMFSASLVSSITTAMTRLEIMSRQQSQQLVQLRRYLVDNSISRKLSVRVQRNAQHVMAEQKKNLQESKVDLLKLVSEPIRMELHFEVHTPVLMEHPFFCCFNEVNPAGIRKVCHVAVSLLSLSAGDILFSDCETPTNLRMFFPMHGKIYYKHSLADDGVNKDRKKEVEQGSESEEADKDDNTNGNGKDHESLDNFEPVKHDQWLCEGVLWTSWSHCGTLQAMTESRLLVINCLAFHDICAASPMAQLSRYAEAFVEVLNMTDKGYHSDLGRFDETMEDIIAYAFPELIYFLDSNEGRSSATGSFMMGARRNSCTSQTSARSHSNSWRDNVSIKLIAKFRARKEDLDTPGGKRSKLRGATVHNLNALMQKKKGGMRVRMEMAWEYVSQVPRAILQENFVVSWFRRWRAEKIKKSIMVLPVEHTASQSSRTSMQSVKSIPSHRASVGWDAEHSIVGPLSPLANGTRQSNASRPSASTAAVASANLSPQSSSSLSPQSSSNLSPPGSPLSSPKSSPRNAPRHIIQVNQSSNTLMTEARSFSPQNS